MNKERKYSLTVLVACVMGAICYALLAWFYTYTGDDLIYRLSWEEYYKNITGYPLFVLRHWFHLNGRIADKINPFMLSMMPQWLYAIVNGIVTTLMYFVIVKSAKCRSVAGCVVCVSMVALMLTWWDGMMVYVCNLNYVWSAAFGLLGVHLILSNGKTGSHFKLWMSGLFTVVAGGMHEASGVPLACGIVVWLCLSKSYRQLLGEQKVLLWCFLAGALFSMSSPGSYERLFFRTTILDKNLSVVNVVVCSAYITSIMMAWLAVGMSIRSMRAKMLSLVRTPWVIFVVASIVSSAFCAVSGIIGRTGWFSQIFAIIAVLYYYNETGLRISRRVAAVISGVLIVVLGSHFAILLRQQYVMGRELKTAIAEYQKSSDGVVYMDYTRDSQQHPWVLRKARGVPDPSAMERYYINSITEYYGDESRPFVVVPKAVEQMPVSELKGIVPIGNGFYVTDNLNGIDTDRYDTVPFRKDGVKLFLLSSREIDPDNPDYYRSLFRRK